VGKERVELAKAQKKDVTQRVLKFIGRQPFFFYDILSHFQDEEYRDLLNAWSTIRSKEKFDRDEEGRYILKNR
jgi:hypothetical protein